MASVRTVLMSVSVLVGVVGMSGGAAAQIVPPPTAAPPKTPEYVPPPPPVDPPPSPADVAKFKPKVAEPPLQFDYKTLVERDATGKIVPLKQPVHRLALERNPFISTEANMKVTAALAERDAQLERLVAANMDVILKVDDDGFAKVDAKDAKEEIRALKALADPLRLPGGDLTSALKKAGVLDDKQARANQKIVLDYTKELFTELRDAKKKPDGAPKDETRPTGMSSARMVYVMQVEETMSTYHRILAEGAKNVAKFAPAAASAVNAAKDDAGKLDAMRKFMIGAGPGPAAEVVNKIIAGRGK